MNKRRLGLLSALVIVTILGSVFGINHFLIPSKASPAKQTFDPTLSTHMVTGTPVSVAPGTFGIGLVSCRGNDFATGGGAFTTSSASGSLSLSDSFGRPVAAPTGWEVVLGNPSTTTLSFTPVVMCMTPITVGLVTTSTYQVVQSVTSVPPGNFGQSQVSCNAGDFVTGGGSTTNQAGTDLSVANSFPTGGSPPTGWLTTAYNPNNVALNLAAVVVCMKPVTIGGATLSTYVAKGQSNLPSVISVRPGSFESADAACTSGDFSTGGGPESAHVLTGGLHVPNTLSTPVNGPPGGWEVGGLNLQASSLDLWADAVCMKPVSAPASPAFSSTTIDICSNQPSGGTRDLTNNFPCSSNGNLGDTQSYAWGTDNFFFSSVKKVAITIEFANPNAATQGFVLELFINHVRVTDSNSLCTGTADFSAKIDGTCEDTAFTIPTNPPGQQNPTHPATCFTPGLGPCADPSEGVFTVESTDPTIVSTITNGPNTLNFDLVQGSGIQILAIRAIVAAT